MEPASNDGQPLEETVILSLRGGAKSGAWDALPGTCSVRVRRVGRDWIVAESVTMKYTATEDVWITALVASVPDSARAQGVRQPYVVLATGSMGMNEFGEPLACFGVQYSPDHIARQSLHVAYKAGDRILGLP